MKKKFFIVISLILGVIVFSNIALSANEKSIVERFEETKEFVSEKLMDIQSDYNQRQEKQSDYLNVTGIEGYSLVFILDDSSYGLYADFNGDEGYLLICFDYYIREIKAHIDLEYLKNVEFTYFSTMDGFLFLNDETYHKYENESVITPTETGGACYSSGKPGVTIDPGFGFIQGISPDGYIKDPDSYMAEYYSSYSYDDYETTTPIGFFFESKTIEETSYYIHYETYNVFGDEYTRRSLEKCCALTTLLSCSINWKYIGMVSNLPDRFAKVDVSTSITSDKFYNDFGRGQPSDGSYWTTNSREYLSDMHKFYTELRTAAYGLGYSPDKGLPLNAIHQTFNNAVADYRIGDMLHETDEFANTMYRISSGYSAVLTMVNSSSYGNHVAALIGYRRYAKIVSTTVSTKEYVYLYVIADGYSKDITYFNPRGGATLHYIYI